MPTLQEKAEWLVIGCQLSRWEKFFLAKIIGGVRGAGQLNDQQITEYWTFRQIEKVKEIWQKRAVHQEAKEDEPQTPAEPNRAPDQGLFDSYEEPGDV